MTALLSLLLVLALSLLVTRVAAVILMLTGLSRESARFQARSAFTGVGFTTPEAERVVNHPVRRRVILWLMLLGNAGIVTFAATLILTFVGARAAGEGLVRLGLLLAGVAFLWVLGTSKPFDRWLSRLTERALKRWTRLEVRDYASLLHLAGGWRVAEMRVEEEDWIAGRTLAETRLRNEGISVLGIERADGTFLGAPDGGTRIEPRDVLLLYGRTPAVGELDQRRRGLAGDMAHVRAVVEQKRIEEEERAGEAAETEDREEGGGTEPPDR